MGMNLGRHIGCHNHAPCSRRRCSSRRERPFPVPCAGGDAVQRKADYAFGCYVLYHLVVNGAARDV